MVWIEIETRLVLAGVFGLSAFGKLRSTAAFAAYQHAVMELGRVPRRFLRAASRALVVLEVLIAVAVLVRPTALAALVLIPVVLTVFTAALARAIRADLAVVCACFGSADRPVGTSQLARNAALIAVALAALAARLAWPAEPTEVSAGGLLVCLLGALVAAGAVALWDDLAELLRPAPTASR